MQYKNDGVGENNVHQNTFTSYLMTAIRREKNLYLKRKYAHEAIEVAVDIETYFDALTDSFESLDLETYCELREEIESVIKAIGNLGDRERYVFLERILKDKDYKELGSELGVSYYGAATIFSRVIKRIKKELGE